jgi:hypothetical protein
LTFANTSDDPLITLRYAANLLHHGQLVYNLGERVEGYTSPLHLLVAVLVLLVPGGLALLKLKLVSLVFAAATLHQTARLSQAISLPDWARLSVMVAVAGSWNFMLSASNGLETSLVAFLATGAAASLAQPDARARWWIPALWTGFLALSRPDADLIVVFLAIASLACERDSTWWRRLHWLIGPAVSATGLVVFRLAYYGQLVPNTFYAKHLGPVAAAVDGLLYLASSQPLSGVVVGVLIPVLEGWLIWIGVRRFIRVRPGMGFALGIVVAQVLFIFESGGDWMKGGRFLVPAIPALTVLVFCGVEAWLERKRQGGTGYRRSRVAALAVVVLLAAPVGGTYVAPAWGLSSGLGDNALIANGHYGSLDVIWVTAVRLADCLRPGQSVAYSEAGLFGFEHQDLRLIDLRGLTSGQIARHVPAKDKYPWGVQDPRWFVSTSTVGHVVMTSRPAMIMSFDVSRRIWPGNSILSGLYRRAATIPVLGSSQTLLVYLRSGVSCPVLASHLRRI